MLAGFLRESFTKMMILNRAIGFFVFVFAPLVATAATRREMSTKHQLLVPEFVGTYWPLRPAETATCDPGAQSTEFEGELVERRSDARRTTFATVPSAATRARIQLSWPALDNQGRPLTYGNYSPADPQVAPGDEMIAASSNNQIGFYARDGWMLDNYSIKDFFAPLNHSTVFSSANIDVYVDPRLQFSPAMHRFFAVALAEHRGVYDYPPSCDYDAFCFEDFVVLAVSTSSSPFSPWNYYFWPAVIGRHESSSEEFVPGDHADYPMIGMTPDILAISTNVLNPTARSYGNLQILPLLPLVAGQLTIGEQWWALPPPGASFADFIQPASDETAAAGTLTATAASYNTAQVFQFRDLFSGFSSLSVGSVAIDTIQGGVYGLQPGSCPSLDTWWGVWLEAAQRDKKLIIVAENSAGGGNAARVLSIDLSSPPSVKLEWDVLIGAGGTDGESPSAVVTYWFGAANITRDGTTVVVYNRASKDIAPEVRVSTIGADGRLAPSILLRASDGCYVGNGTNGTKRWADLACAAIDPTNSDVVWVAAQYVVTDNPNFGVYVGAIEVPPVPVDPIPKPVNTTSHPER